MICMILVSVLIGSSRSLSQLAGQVNDAFFQGVNGDGLSIQNDLQQRMNDAYNLVVVGRRYLQEDDAAITQVLTAREALANAQTPSEKYQKNNDLTAATTELYYKLQEQQLSEKDAQYNSQLYAELSSRNTTIQNDGYNQMAEDFNRTLQQFPANLLSKVVFVQPAELFR